MSEVNLGGRPFLGDPPGGESPTVKTNFKIPRLDLETFDQWIGDRTRSEVIRLLMEAYVHHAREADRYGEDGIAVAVHEIIVRSANLVAKRIDPNSRGEEEMSTNYYVVTKNNVIIFHIGQSSIGNQFLYHASPDWRDQDVNKFYDFWLTMLRLMGTRIECEYGSVLTESMLMEIVRTHPGDRRRSRCELDEEGRAWYSGVFS